MKVVGDPMEIQNQSNDVLAWSFFLRGSSEHQHKRTTRKCTIAAVGIIAMIVASLCTVRDEMWTTRQLLASWSNDNKKTIPDAQVSDGRYTSLPSGADRLSTSMINTKKHLPFHAFTEPNAKNPKSRRNDIHAQEDKAKGLPSLTNKTGPLQYKRVVTFFSGNPQTLNTSKTVARLVDPLATPSFLWATNDLTRGYDNVDSSDESVHMEMRQWPSDELDPKCKPIHKWQSMQFPVCNTVHESCWGAGLDSFDKTLMRTNGFWRNVWSSQRYNQTLVWKTFKLEHSMEDAFFENSRVDGLAMERLTASPFVISMYAFCAMTVVQEFAGKDLSSLPSNTDPKIKLEVAAKAAQAIADVHSIDSPIQPSLAHNDINLANLVMTSEGRPVLNDFNIAILLKKHNETGEICPFKSVFPNPQWRSPEEQVYSEEESETNPPIVTEKVDIYGLGNLFFRLIVGKGPWKRPGQTRLNSTEKDEVAHMKRENGTLPHVPDEVRNSTTREIVLIREAMYKCYRFNPKLRPSAREIVAFLKQKH